MSQPVLPAIPVVVVSLGNVSEKCSLAALLWRRTTSDSFQCHFLWRAGSGLFLWGVASGNRHEKGNFYFNLVTIPVYHWLSSSFPFLFSFHPIPKAIMEPTFRSNCPQLLAGARTATGSECLGDVSGEHWLLLPERVLLHVLLYEQPVQDDRREFQQRQRQPGRCF